MKYVFFAFFALFFSLSFSQTINGVVMDSITNKPLVFVNLGIQNTKYGTTTNYNGEFEFEKKNFPSDSKIIISYLGYQTKEIILDDLLLEANNILYLKEKIDHLDEVLLTTRRYSDIEHLNGKKKKTATLNFPYGYEYALYIENKKQTKGIIKSLNIYFNEVKQKKKLVKEASYRLFFYQINDNLKPGKVLYSENIIIKPSNITQKYLADLSAFNIEFPREGVYVGIESLDSEKIKSIKNFITSPGLVITHTKSPKSFFRHYGNDWKKFIMKSMTKKNYSFNLLLDIDVKYLKD